MGSGASDSLVCGRTLEEFLQTIESFHGWKAPGLVLGGFMVDWAQELIGTGVETDAIVESSHCLPDAIQLFTPCTIGNGWLKIVDWDKFAICLYDRNHLNGVRVWLDIGKLKDFPDLYNWYMRLVPKKSLPLEVLLETILAARRSVLSASSIRMKELFQRKKKTETDVCDQCGEAYSTSQGEICSACQGAAYYDVRK